MHRKYCPYCVRYYGYPDNNTVNPKLNYHDIDVCPVYTNYQQTYTEQTIRHRRETYDYMQEIGFGIGTIIKTRYTIGTSLWWVLGFEWDLIYPARFNGGDYYNYLNSLVNCPIRACSISDHNVSNFVTPYSIKRYNMPSNAYHYYDIISESGVPPLPPLDWYSTQSCKYIVDSYLRTL